MDLKSAEEKAMEKVAIILPLVDKNIDNATRIKLQKEISLSSGVSYRTLSRWIKVYNESGFKGFVKKRSEVTRSSVISEEVIQEAIKLRRENVNRSVKTLIFILEQEGLCKPGTVKRQTLQRVLAERGFSYKQMCGYLKKGDLSKTRFQKTHRMELVQADYKDGYYLPLGEKGKPVKIHLHSFMDDSTRCILAAQWYSRETTFELEDTLRQMLKKYGKPDKLLLDNGSPYKSKRFKNTCKQLGIKIRYCGPFQSQTKGKIERYHQEIDKFIDEVALKNCTTLEQVNENFKLWLEAAYHQKINTEVNEYGTIKETFKNDSRLLNFVDSDMLDSIFMVKETRKVSKIGTISIGGDTYEIDNINLRYSEVEVIFNPMTVREDGVIVRKIGYKDAKATLQVIGENANFKRDKQIIEERGKLPTNKSRLLDALEKKYKESRDDLDLNLLNPPTKKVYTEQDNVYTQYQSEEDENE